MCGLNPPTGTPPSQPGGSSGGIATATVVCTTLAYPKPDPCPWDEAAGVAGLGALFIITQCTTIPRPVPVSIPRPRPPQNRGRGWTCNCWGATRGGSNFPSDCPEMLEGTAWGTTQHQASVNAKRVANHSVPGCWVGHLQCRCWKGR